MSDFIHWDDSDLDLDELLGDYTDYDAFSNTDVWSDDDIFNEDVHLDKPDKPNTVDSTKGRKSENDKENVGTRSLYTCPMCRKTYRSIVGFRGHVTKKHDRPDIKAQDHKKHPSTISDESLSSSAMKPGHSTFFSPLSTEIELHNALADVIPKAADAIVHDPLMDGWCSLNGPHLIKIGNDLADNPETNPKLADMCAPRFHQILLKFGQGSSLASDRDRVWKSYHQVRIDRNFTTNMRICIKAVTSESERMVHIFVQCLLDKIIEKLFELISLSITKAADKASTDMSENDQSVLFYISGYVLFAVCKHKKISGFDIEPIIQSLTTDSGTKEMYIKRFRKWTDKMNRGGLKIPSDNFFLMIRFIETIIRNQVCISKLSASSLLCDKLKEDILTSTMVSYYWDKLVVGEEEMKLKLLEYIVNLFLRVRGGATAKYSKRQLQKRKKAEKKKQNGKRSNSLRKALKSCDHI